jgi:hypothetical protein
MRMRGVSALLLGAALSAAALAPNPAAAQPQTQPQPQPEVEVPVATPPPPLRDGARVLGRLGLGTFGRVSFDVGDDVPALQVDSIGLRYWFAGDGPGPARAWGLDLGLAFAFERARLEQGGSDVESSSTAVGVHAGLPLVLAQLPHANFEVVPEVDVVFLGGELAGADLSGVAVAAGARAGFELFFGFIGVPDLSLEASVALGFSHVTTTVEQGGAETKRSATFIGLRKLDDPWDIFRSSVAARYYF